MPPRISADAMWGSLRQAYLASLRSQQKMRLVCSVFGGALQPTKLAAPSETSMLRRTFATAAASPPEPLQQHRIDRIMGKQVGELTDSDLLHIKDNIVRSCKPLFKTREINTLGLKQAERLLDRLVSENEVRSNPVSPDAAWNALLRAYAQNPDQDSLSEPAFIVAHNVLLRIQQLHKQDPNIHPPANHYQISQVLRACANENTDEACELAEGLVHSLEDIGFRMNLELYNNVMMLYSKRAAHSYDALGKAEDWLLHMAKRSAEVVGSPSPDTQTFNLVLIAWKDCPDELGAQRAMDVLEIMMKLGEENKNVRPDPASFGIVIGAFGNRGQPRNSQVVLEKAFTYFTEHFDSNKPLPDLSQCWTNVCYSWARSGFRDSPLRVDELLWLAHEIRNTSIAKKVSLAPNTAMHGALLEAFLTSQRLDRVDRADQHLWKMIDNFVARPQAYEREAPSLREFASVLHAWYRKYGEVDVTDPDKHARTAGRAEKLLEAMINLSERIKPRVNCSPEANHFMHCIKLWCDASKAYSGNRSQQQTKNEDGISEAMKAVQKAVDLLNVAEERRIPMFEGYAFVVNALCKTREVGALEAVDVLERLESQRDRGLVEWSSKAAGLYTAVISSLSAVQSIEAAEKALSILKGMPPSGDRVAEPTSRTYTSVITSFAKLDRINSKRACAVVLELYDTMKQHDKDTTKKVKLDRVVFEGVLWTLAKSSDPEMLCESVSILLYMAELYQQGRKEAEPTQKCLDCCIQVGLNIRGEAGLRSTVDLLSRVVQMWRRGTLRNLPSEKYFGWVAGRCDKAGMKTEAAQIAAFVGSLQPTSRSHHSNNQEAQ